MDKYIGRILLFRTGTGCIPPMSRCYCYAIDGEHVRVVFEHSILGSRDIKLHKNVIMGHANVVG